MQTLLFVIGTRPEAIKLAPVINLAKRYNNFRVLVCNTGQHDEMLEQVNDVFNLKYDFFLNSMREASGDITKLLSIVIAKLNPYVKECKPDYIVVQGDTTSALAGALVGCFNMIKVVHVEAGLRSFDNNNPFPEEYNRKLIASVAEIHFSPTQCSYNNLLSENIPKEKVFITGNTVIDALLSIRANLAENPRLFSHIHSKLGFIDLKKNIILVTTHRRENHGSGIRNICMAIKELALERGDVQFIYPVHLNPVVKEIVYEVLGNISNVYLTEPLDYLCIVYLLEKSKIILTDSGGIQEEATAFNTPVLVLREKTERTEGIDAGVAKTVGVNRVNIISEVRKLLDDKMYFKKMSAKVLPYGNGFASKEILSKIALMSEELSCV